MTVDSPYPGIPLTQLPIKASPTTSAYSVIADGGAFLALGFGGGSGNSCSCITNAPVITPVYITDYVPIVRSGLVYLATVQDVLHAGSVLPSTPYLNFSISSNSMYIGVI